MFTMITPESNELSSYNTRYLLGTQEGNEKLFRALVIGDAVGFG